MRKTRKRIADRVLAAVLSLMMIVGLMPMNTFALEKTPAVLSTNISEQTFIVGEPTVFEFETVANDDANTLVKGAFVFSDPDAIEKLEYLESKDGNWYEFNGDFGPESGFPMINGKSSFRVTFNKIGNYTVTASMKTVKDGTVLCSTEETVVVKGKPATLSTTITDGKFNVGVEKVFTYTTTANDDKDTMVRGAFTFSDPDAIEKLEYLESKNGEWYVLDGEFGPETGFPMIDGTSTFRVTFTKPGNYSVKVEMKSVTDNTVLCSLVSEVEVEHKVTTSVTKNEGGAVLIDDEDVPSKTVDAGSSMKITAVADEGYRIASLNIGGAIISNAYGQIEFSANIKVSRNVEVAVTFVKVHTVTITHNENGGVEILDPATIGGTVTVENGTDVKISATPEENYRVSEVTINGDKEEDVSGENNSGYEKILNADKDYTVVITFAPNVFDITKVETENGSVIVGSDSVEYNGSCNVTVTPKPGYSVTSIKVNGTVVDKYETDNGSVKFDIENVTEDQKVEATFVATEKANVEIESLFDAESAIYHDGMTYIYKNDGTVTFTTDKDGIILYNKDNEIIGGGEDVKSVTISETTEIAKIELVYKADSEMLVVAHEVEGISEDSPLKIVIDKDAPVGKLTPDKANENGFYNKDFNVRLDLEGDFSGIDSIEYFITSTIVSGEYDEIQDSDKTEFDTLYTYRDNDENIKVKNEITVDIPVTASKNDSDNVVVWAKITDRAGNVETIKTEAMKVCVTAPKLVSVDISGTEAADAEDGYFDTVRKATITIVDRASAFNESNATDSIKITAKDYNGGDVVISKNAMISWVSNGDNHVGTIIFDKAANYTWSFEYTNGADLDLDKSSAVETGNNIYEFTVDRYDAPTATISVDADNTWDKIVSTLTFGIWKNYNITTTITEINDNISGVKEVVYYKSNSEVELEETELETLYNNGKFITDTYTVSADEKFVIYARVTDKAGNTIYVSTDGLIYDLSKSVITLKPEEPNKNGFYNHDVKVDISVNEVIEGKEAYSGIKTIDYKVVKDNDEANPTQSRNLYTFDVKKPKYADLKSSWNDVITVDAELNNSDNVKVIVTVVDNAGNEKTEEITLAINVDVIEATITLDGVPNKVVDERGYFDMTDRIATIEIVDRASAFDEVAATAGVVVKNDKDQVVTSGYTISPWNHNDNKHTATVTFSDNENYVWSYNYTNLADNVLESENIDTGNSVTPYVFTVDDKDPEGTITVKENTWYELLKLLTFGIFDNEKIDISATYDDETSPVTVEYIKVCNDDAPILLSKDDLDDLYEDGKFSAYADFSVTTDEQFVVYIRITDYAGNYIYICSDGAIVDTKPSEIVITPENANENGLYGHAYDDGIKVDISVSDAEPYSGIKSVDYKVIKDNDFDNPTQSGNLYTFNNPAPEQSDLQDTWTGSITVDPDKNNSCNVIVHVTVVDNAGNKSTNSKAIDIDVTNPTIDISFDDEVEVNKIVEDRGYFAGKRVATVTITERTHHFDEIAATEGIVIEAVNAKGESVPNAYEISSWETTKGVTPDEDSHTAIITFKEDANYTWSISYKDKADNQNEIPSTGASVTPYTFTVDTKEPSGTVTITTFEERVETWEDLRETITFGIWSKNNITVTGTSDDVTSEPSGNIVEYYKAVATSATDGITALTWEELDSVTTWEEFTSLKVEKDEQFVVYIKITDLAGNYTYISTNGLIVDHNAPFEEIIAPEVSVEPEHPTSNIYNDDVKVDIKVVDSSVGGTYSGLKKIWYEVKNMGEVTQGGEDKPLYEFTETNPKQEDLLQTWTGSITVDSKLNNSNDVEIIVYALDNSMNGSEKSISIKIDITAPTIEVSYDNNAADSDTFFKDDRTATVVVTERNFDPKDVLVTITNTDGVIPTISEFEKVEGTGNGDDTTWTATIKYTADGDYEFDIAYTDLSDNACAGETFVEGTVASNAFTIDHTIPVIEVSYDNNNVQNGNYYKDYRTATVVITEHNFNADRVTITHTATDDGAETTKPVISGWTSNGDKHTATISYSKDAKYTFDIAMNDKAGNASVDYAEETFFVDTTMPALEISGVADLSANNGDVIPVVTYSDTNYDADRVTITLTGTNRDGVELDGSYSDIHNGRVFTFKNFAKEQAIDDIYTLTAKLTDKAGNTTEKTITFSVNRFGSTYALSEEAEKLNGTYVKEPVDVVITETNADELSNIKVTLFKDGETIVLKENTDYKIDLEGGNGQWYHYTYTVFAKNFKEDGVYSLTVESDDKAGNEAKNDQDTKDTAINFGVDSTLPIINIENLESETTYALDKMTVTMNVKDNLKLTKVIVELDGKEYRTWEAEELEEIIKNGGNFSFEIEGNVNARNLVVYAVDAAGNGEKISDTELPANVEKVEDFYVTTNLWVRYYTNPVLFYGSIIGIIVLAGFIVFLIYKKKKDEEGK